MQIVEAVQAMVETAIGQPVVIGSNPPLGGISLAATGGAVRRTFRPLSQDGEMAFVLNGKNADQEFLSATLSRAHAVLTRTKALPFDEEWQIYAIETTSAPALIGREENKNFIYGSSFRVKFYLRRSDENA